MSDIVTKVQAVPNRYGLHAREGWGKTSLCAYMRKPVFIQTKGETGLTTLISNNQLPFTPHLPEIQTWEELQAAIAFLKDEQHDFRTLVIDTVNGAERLCYEYVCNRDFDGDWGDKGFTGYMRGYEVSQSEWRMFLNSLDELRAVKKMTVMMLFHSKVKTFKNPGGADYDRFAPDMHEKAWSLTHKWLDCVLFGDFETIVKTTKTKDDEVLRKGKASSSVRVIYTQQGASYDAKNRLGLPAIIDVEGNPKDAAATLLSEIRKSTAPVTQAVAQDAVLVETATKEVS